MIAKIDKLISYSFYSLFLLVPFAVYSKTSELFEFNKIVLTYILTVLVVFFWITKMALLKKIIFKKTIIDKFLIIFFLSQLASTLFSVDVRTSLFGYYSRFHGGLFSTISYILLYWAYVSNMNYEKTKKAIYIFFSSTFLVCIWAILEHFGRSFSCLIFEDFKTFDVSCWVQDVQNRVYATFGQPNWLAAWIVALIPLTWAFAINYKAKKVVSSWKSLIFSLLSIVFFITLLYTKSRSGILAFVITSIIFWAAISAQKLVKKVKYDNLLISSFVIILPILFFAFTIGTPWTLNLGKILNKNSDRITSNESPSEPEDSSDQRPTVTAPALEVGGTESGQIRLIVWKGALDMWKNNPIFGTGVETFAYSYYKYRPLEHNLVSEWNFLYNKAHNEYLNIAATTGTVGLFSYLALISTILYLFIIPLAKSKQDHHTDTQLINIAFFSGFISILITNFLGFSVVPVALQFFLFPAMAVSLTNPDTDSKEQNEESEKLSNSQVTSIFFALCFLLFALFSIGKYWYADTLYARGKLENDSGLFANARATLLKAIELSPKESVYWDELSSATSRLALLYAENNDVDTAAKIAISAANEGIKATTLSPANLVIKKSQAQNLANLAVFNISYLEKAKNTLHEALKSAPTDAQITYNLALIYYKLGDKDKFIDYLKKSVEMKPNYKNARFNLALYYTNEEKVQEAINEYKYILENIGYDTKVEEELNKLEKDSD